MLRPPHPRTFLGPCVSMARASNGPRSQAQHPRLTATRNGYDMAIFTHVKSRLMLAKTGISNDDLQLTYPSNSNHNFPRRPKAAEHNLSHAHRRAPDLNGHFSRITRCRICKTHCMYRHHQTNQTNPMPLDVARYITENNPETLEAPCV